MYAAGNLPLLYIIRITADTGTAYWRSATQLGSDLQCQVLAAGSHPPGSLCVFSDIYCLRQGSFLFSVALS